MFSKTNAYRLSLSTMLGTIMEWYDFSVYVFLVPYIAGLFFPSDNHHLSIIYSYFVFMLGFLARPIGGMLFGSLGDRLGRRAALLISMLLMTVSTALLGCLPTFQQAGYLAPIMFITLRLLQGLGGSGEISTSLTYVFEMSPIQKRGFFTALVWVGSGLGISLGSAVVALLAHSFSDQTIMLWAWRLPFFLAIFTGGFGLLIRYGLGESSVIQALKISNAIVKQPICLLMKRHKKTCIKVVALFTPVAVSYYIMFVFMPNYLSMATDIPNNQLLMVNSCTSMTYMVLTCVLGYFSDKIGRRRLMIAGLIMLILFSTPLHYKIHRDSIFEIFLIQSGFGLILSCYSGAVVAEVLGQLVVKLRCSILGLGYNLAYSIFGGTAPLILALMQPLKYSSLYLALYITAVALIALPIVLRINRLSGN